MPIFRAFRGPCGPSLENRSSTQCVTIGECDKNVKGHLNHYKVWDTSVNSEEKLLLARAGNTYNFITCTYNQKSCTLGLDIFLFNFFKLPVQRQLGIVDSDVVSKLLQAVEGSPSDSGVNFVRFQIVE